MYNYAKTTIPQFLSVQAIVTIYYLDLKNTRVCGESHSFWEFLYVDKGEHNVLIDGVLYHLEAGQLVMYAPYAYHCEATNRPSSEAQVGIISFESDSENMSFFANKVISLNAGQRELLSQIITFGIEAFWPLPSGLDVCGVLPHEEVQDYELQKLKNQLELLLIDLYKIADCHMHKAIGANQGNYKKLQFDALTSYLRQHLGTMLTLEQISDDFNISVTYLKNLFREYCGCGPITYFTTLKIDAAKRMIRETSLNFTQIAEQLGFHSIHYFSKVFKEKTGKTLSAYARSVNKQ